MTQHIRSFVTLAAISGIAFVGCAKDSMNPTPATMPAKVAPLFSHPVAQPSVGEQKRFGDEIVVAGHFYRIGTPVVTWMDPGGYNAYSVDRRFVPPSEAGWEPTTQAMAAGKVKFESKNQMFAPERYGIRYLGMTNRVTALAATQPGGLDEYVRTHFDGPTTRPLSPDEFQEIRGGGWSLPQLQNRVDQFVLHYDVAGISSECFRTLQDVRGLSVQFMLDIDGTIYQTLDLKERAFQATKANDRSVGIEIANIGSYSASETNAPLQQWYKKDENGKTYIAVPERLGGEKATRIPGIYRPARNDVIVGQIRGVTERMYDITPEQYASLIKLTAALGDVLPKIKMDYPRGPDGKVLTRTLTDDEYDHYSGVLGHFHVQENKSDPGVALQWDYLIDNAKRLLAERKPMTASK